MNWRLSWDNCLSSFVGFSTHCLKIANSERDDIVSVISRRSIKELNKNTVNCTFANNN